MAKPGRNRSKLSTLIGETATDQSRTRLRNPCRAFHCGKLGHLPRNRLSGRTLLVDPVNEIMKMFPPCAATGQPRAC